VKKECMGQTAYKDFTEFNQYLFSGDFVKMFKSIGKFYMIGFDMSKTCRFNELAFEVTGFCLDKKNNCTIDNMIVNFQAKFFDFTDAMNKIAQVLFNEYNNLGKQNYSNVDESEQNFEDLGKSFGRVVRAITKFTKTASEGGKKRKPSNNNNN
jgi:hypothetical protein